MSASIEFIKDRATKTLSAATQLAAMWVWQEKTLLQMQAALTAIIGDATATPAIPGQEAVVSTAEQGMLAARGAWDTQLDLLHRRTVQGVGMAKNRWRDNPAKRAMLSGLSASSNSRSETLKEALAWESAWAQVDAAWSPLPANTFGAFQTLRNQCEEGLKKAYSDAHAEWREAAETLAELGRELEDINQAWYADATLVFPVGTPEGDMIRGTVPTTYSPPPHAPVVPPTPPTPPHP